MNPKQVPNTVQVKLTHETETSRKVELDAELNYS